jgi:imidazolonepropionase-like amidohydrolase
MSLRSVSERAIALLGALCLNAFCALPASAFAPQEGGGEGGGPPPEGGEEEEAEDQTDVGEWLAVIGGEVHTGTGAVLRGATVLAKDGVIRAIGQGLHVPAEAKRIDASGLRVYPGLVAFDSSGLIGNAGSDFADTIDPFNSRLVLALAAGITTAGQSEAAVKLKRGEIEGVLMREKYLVLQNYASSNPTGKKALVEKLARASEYLREYRVWEEKKKDDKELKEPSRKGVDSNVLAILRGEVLARFNADSRSELLDIARLAQRYNFRPVIIGCAEGWTVADELGRAGAFAVVTPRYRRDKEEQFVRPGGSSIENAALLHKAGVQVAIVPAQKSVDLGGIVGRDILHLTIEAGFAVRGGLSEQAALEAITLVPARLLGVDHRVGTLEVGKDCDLVLTDGDILHYQTFVQYAVVAGKQVYDKQAELYFAHIRPRPSAELAPETRVDPGTEPIEEPAAPEPDDPDDPEQPEETPKGGEPEEGGGG